MLKILAGYGVGPKMLALLKHFWDMAQLVCRARGNYLEVFSAERGITQGGPLSSLMFNVCVHAVAREWLHQMLGDEAACDGLRDHTAEILMAFYIDDGLLASCDPVRLRNHLMYSSDCLNGLVFSRMLPR